MVQEFGGDLLMSEITSGPLANCLQPSEREKDLAKQICAAVIDRFGPGLTDNDRVYFVACHLAATRVNAYEHCATIVRAKKPPEASLWWLRDEFESLAKEIERNE